MASLVRSFRQHDPSRSFICSRCLQFSTLPSLMSGHNRWSKIKHDKGAADKKMAAQRTMFSKQITLASKLHGADPSSNPRLASALAAAKKAGFPKASMDAAVARGQGRSSDGATLENITLEVLFPPGISLIVDAETDKRARTLQDMRSIVRNHGGTVTPTAYLFTKKGRISFEKDERNLSVDQVLEEAIEAGAEDVETDEEGHIVIWTEPSNTASTAEALNTTLGLKVETSDIIWDANEETRFKILDETTGSMLCKFLDGIQEVSGVQGIYANIAQGDISNEGWEELQERLDG